MKFVFLVILAPSICLAEVSRETNVKYVCTEQSSVHKVTTPLLSHHLDRLLADHTREESYVEKVELLIPHISRSHGFDHNDDNSIYDPSSPTQITFPSDTLLGKENEVISRQDLAELIAWTATCTGHNFVNYRALLQKESQLCRDRHNKGGGDSGCGQFVSLSLNEIKGQFQFDFLSRNQKWVPKDQQTQAFENLVKSCYANTTNSDETPRLIVELLKDVAPEDRADFGLNRFRDFYNRPNIEIQEDLRVAKAIDLDLLATAIYLKFCIARRGDYIVPGSKPGAYACYNGGGTRGYAASVNRLAQNINYTCYEDTYTSDIAKYVCLDSVDPQECLNHLLNNKQDGLDI